MTILKHNSVGEISIAKLAETLNKSKFLENSIVKHTLVEMQNSIFNSEKIDLN